MGPISLFLPTSSSRRLWCGHYECDIVKALGCYLPLKTREFFFSRQLTWLNSRLQVCCLCWGHTQANQRLGRLYVQLGGPPHRAVLFWGSFLLFQFSSLPQIQSFRSCNQKNLASAQVATSWDLPSSEKPLKMGITPSAVLGHLPCTFCLLLVVFPDLYFLKICIYFVQSLHLILGGLS